MTNRLQQNDGDDVSGQGEPVGDKAEPLAMCQPTSFLEQLVATSRA